MNFLILLVVIDLVGHTNNENNKKHLNFTKSKI